MKGLGQRIRTLRKLKRLTLVELSQKSGIDPATLSRMENGKMTGTVESHSLIAGVLGIQLPDLYGDVIERLSQEKDQKIRQKLAGYSHSNGAIAELLTTSVMQKKMMPLLIKIKGKGRTEGEQFPVFTERFLYVLKGKFEVEIGKERRQISEGESLYFDGAQYHRAVNLGSTEGKLLSVITPVSL